MQKLCEQINLFDTEARAKRTGMAFAEHGAPKQGWDLEEMRRWARHYIHTNQSMRDIGIPNVVWIDKIRQHFNIQGLAGSGNNFLGSLFKKGFVFTGEWIKTKTEGCHNRVVRLWTLKGCYPNFSSFNVVSAKLGSPLDSYMQLRPRQRG